MAIREVHLKSSALVHLVLFILQGGNFLRGCSGDFEARQICSESQSVIYQAVILGS